MLRKSEKISISLNSSLPNFANWQPQNSSSRQGNSKKMTKARLGRMP